MTTSTTAQRLATIEHRLGLIDARLDSFNLNGHLKDLVSLAQVSPDLITLAQVAPALTVLAASATTIASLVADEAVLRDLADHRTQAVKLQDARDYVHDHDQAEMLRKWRRPLRAAKWVAPFIAGALVFRVMAWIDPSPIFHVFVGR